MKLVKSSFHLSNIILIIFYLYPASLLGCYLYDDCQFQPQLTRDLSYVSSNHFYSFIFISLIGLFSFKKKIKVIMFYLVFLSIVLELTHLIIPYRAFELQDLFGNFLGVVLSYILFKIINKIIITN